MESKYKLYRNVQIGQDCQLGEFALIGIPPKGKKDGELVTTIGAGALIRSHSVIYAGNTIGSNFQTGHGVLIREQNEIGNNVSIGTSSVIEHHVKIADNVRIHSQAFIPEYSTLEEGCWIGPSVVLTNTLHPLCSEAKKCIKGPTIGRNAKVGANSTLLPDITIGENSLIGAGSVVIEDIPANRVAIGNPAKVIKSINELDCPYGLLDRPY